MSYNELRKGRASIAGHIYLITAVTTHRQPLFSELTLGRIVVNELRSLEKEYAAQTLAFVVMPDHLHWLMQMGNTLSLSEVVKRCKGRSGMLITKALGKSGSIWQPAFHDHAVRHEESLIEIARYIVMNPVRAGLVARVEDYSLWDSRWL